jgi:hypothetical protein
MIANIRRRKRFRCVNDLRARKARSPLLLRGRVGGILTSVLVLWIGFAPIGSTPLAFSQQAPSDSAASESAEGGQWISLFNGKDLQGWTPKIRHHALGENYGNTFRVEDGLLKVRYDAEHYPTFDERYGHLFCERPFSHYRLRVEYRFVGEQCPQGPGWAIRNSGMMLHCEDPQLMTLEQEFPTSIEVQLLGGDGREPRTTANLCTPGTNVVLNGQLHLPHCTSSTSETYHGDQWVTVEVEVRGADVIRHVIDGKVVLEYSQPQLDERDEHAKMLAEKQGGLLLTGGHISLQSESHPIDFRKVELMELEGRASDR